MGRGEDSTMRNFIVCTVIKSRRLRWAGHVARMEGLDREITWSILLNEKQKGYPSGNEECKYMQFYVVSDS